MAEVLFAQSYILRHDPKEFRNMAPYPPLGTLYGAARVRDEGYRVAVFDAMLAEGPEDILPYLGGEAPEWVVIYDDDFNYLTKMCLTRMREVAFRIARLTSEAGATVIVHSSDATDHREAYLDAGADYILIGEAEQTLVDLLDRLSGRSSTTLDSIPGICYRDPLSGDLHTSPARRVTRRLDTIPFPARDLIDIDRYREIWVREHGRFSMNMVTTRGCPFHCNWCAKPLYGQIYSSRSPTNVAAEMEMIAQEWNPDHIWFCDDIFGLKPGWVEEFADELRKRGVRIPFKGLSRADLLLRGRTIEGLRDAGCETIWIGAESGSQKILDAMEKGTTIEQIAEARRRLKQTGIRVGFFLQFGYPGEEEEEIGATIDMVRRLVPDEIGISVSYPLPGTPFYDRVVAEMKAQQNWSESADLAMMFEGAYPTSFYRALARYVHKDHRLRLGIEAMRRVVRGKGVPPEGIRRALLTPYYAATRVLHRTELRRHTFVIPRP